MESALVRKCHTYAKARGWFCLKLSDKSTYAIPDSYFLKSGRSVWVEFKSKNDKRKNLLQKWMCQEINLHDGEAYFGVDDFDFFKDIVDNTHTI